MSDDKKVEETSADCCEQLGNRRVLESTMSKTVEQCGVCGRKHYSFGVDPLRVGLKFS